MNYPTNWTPSSNTEIERPNYPSDWHHEKSKERLEAAVQTYSKWYAVLANDCDINHILLVGEDARLPVVAKRKEIILGPYRRQDWECFLEDLYDRGIQLTWGSYVSWSQGPSLKRAGRLLEKRP